MTFISYAQNSEDVLLWRALGHVPNGFYIDVGANDPQEHSVTKAFYDAGWHGISIEPLPSFHQAFLEQRPRDVNLAIAAGSTDGELTLYDTPDMRGWASPDQAVAEMHRAEGHQVAELTVPVRTLTSVCEQHVRGEIHFLKIDVEGFEGEVLRGMDFARWRPWVLVIEATLPNSRATNHATWEHLVTGQRYRFAWFDGLNRYYVAQEHSELLAHFGIQPNVFDDFISHHLDKAWAAGEQLTTALRGSERHAAELATALDQAGQQADQLRKDVNYALVRADSAEQERRLADQERREAELARHQAEHDRRQAETERRLAEHGFGVAEQGRLKAEKALLQTEHQAERAIAEAHRAAQLEMDRSHAAARQEVDRSHAAARQEVDRSLEAAQQALHQAHQAEQMRLQAIAEGDALRAALGASQASAHQLTEWARGLEQQLLATHVSTSWRVTRPLRVAGQAVRALRRPGLARRVLARVTANERLRRLLIPVLLRYPRLGKRVTASLSAIKQAAPAPMAAPEAAAAAAAVAAAVPDEFKGLPVSVRVAMTDLRRARATQHSS